MNMANAHRGEIEAHLDGKPYALCLTLGALAELEHEFGDDDMIALAARFETGRISANDCVRIVGAGLRGAGHDISNDVVATMKADLGAAGFIEIVARLLAVTFGAAQGDLTKQSQIQSQPQSESKDMPPKHYGEEREIPPFPGTRF